MKHKHINNENKHEVNEKMYRSSNILGAFLIIEVIVILALFLFQILF